MVSMDILKMILEAVAGLVLFLYGVSKLAENLREIAGDRMKQMLTKSTKNQALAVLTGTVTTTVLDSSSVTIIMVIALVNASLLTFTQSLGVIMGANIGTTISSQLITFKINEYASIILAIGFLIHLSVKRNESET